MEYLEFGTLSIPLRTEREAKLGSIHLIQNDVGSTLEFLGIHILLGILLPRAVPSVRPGQGTFCLLQVIDQRADSMCITRLILEIMLPNPMRVTIQSISESFELARDFLCVLLVVAQIPDANSLDPVTALSVCPSPLRCFRGEFLVGIRCLLLEFQKSE